MTDAERLRDIAKTLQMCLRESNPALYRVYFDFLVSLADRIDWRKVPPDSEGAWVRMRVSGRKRYYCVYDLDAELLDSQTSELADHTEGCLWLGPLPEPKEGK